MQRTLEIIFHQWRRTLALVLVLPLVSVAVIFTLPRSYQASASLWALRRYEVIGATGVESDLTSTPAQTQATALTELLQTRAFALGVADATSLPSTLAASVSGNPTTRDDALVADISKNVVITPQGYSLFTVTYQNRNPLVARQVVQAVMDAFDQQSGTLSVITGKQLLATYQAQLASAQKAAQAAAAAQSAYVAAHPSETPAMLQTDAPYVSLQTSTQQAQAAVQQLQGEITTLNQSIDSLQGGATNTLFSVIDAPTVPDRAVSRTKLLLEGGIVGLLVGLLACAAYLVVIFRRRRAIYGALDVAHVTALPIIAEFPDLPSFRATPLSTGDALAPMLVGSAS